mmetsp:Transcript_3461/g.5928  ORF Transcript_3461/g.5928 Transcript_3461/m.5928 type:complete len:179 (+) Transcript_3461:132-668(+)
MRVLQLWCGVGMMVLALMLGTSEAGKYSALCSSAMGDSLQAEVNALELELKQKRKQLKEWKGAYRKGLGLDGKWCTSRCTTTSALFQTQLSMVKKTQRNFRRSYTNSDYVKEIIEKHEKNHKLTKDEDDLYHEVMKEAKKINKMVKSANKLQNQLSEFCWNDDNDDDKEDGGDDGIQS